MRNHVTERKGKRRSRAPRRSEVSRLRSDTAHNRREIRLYHCYMSGSESSIGVGSRRRTCPVLLTYFLYASLHITFNHHDILHVISHTRPSHFSA